MDQTDDEFLEHAKAYQESEQPEPEREPEKQAEPDPTPEPSRPEHVPFATFLQEKNARRDAERQSRELTERLKALEEKLDKVVSPPETPPDPQEDPFGAVQHELKSVKAQLETQAKTQEERDRERGYQEAQTQLNQMEKDFAEKNPDYWEAARFLRDFQYRTYEALGVPEDQRDEAFRNEMISFVTNTMNTGRNPFEVAYNLAKTRGFTPKQMGEAQKKAERQVKDTARKLQGSATLQGESGKPHKDRIDVADAANLDEAEFEKLFVGRDKEDAFRQLMGG